MDIVTVKTCALCNETKNIEHFSYNICKDCKYKKKRDWYLLNKDRVKKYNKEWQLSNPDYEKIYKRKERLENPEKVNNYKRKLYHSKRLQYRDAAKKRFKNDPEKYLSYNRKRRAFKKNAEGVISPKEWTRLIEKYENKCLSCNGVCVEITMDHIIPLSKGGKHSIENVQPLCKSCNSKKGTKTIDYRPEYK